MKKLLLSFTLLTSLYGSSQILSEGFEGETFPPAGWTTDTQVATRFWRPTTDYTVATQEVYNITGAKSAIIAWIVDPNEANLTSPSFSLDGYSDATFSFNAKVGYEYMVAPFPNGNLNVQISDNGLDWITLWVEEDQGPFDDYETLAVSLDLADYVGQSGLQIRFQYLGTDADTLSVDDILITGTLGVNESFANKFSTYPNPADNSVNISNNFNILLTDVSITDVNGRTVKTLKVNNLSQVEMNVSDLNSGVYFMNINTDSGKAIKKFIKS